MKLGAKVREGEKNMEFPIIRIILSHNFPKRFSNSPWGKISPPPSGHNAKKSEIPQSLLKTLSTSQ